MLVAERAARRLEVVDSLRKRVAGEVDARLPKPSSARPERRRVRPVRLLRQEVVECLRAEVTSGQSSLDEPSTPR